MNSMTNQIVSDVEVEAAALVLHNIDCGLPVYDYRDWARPMLEAAAKARYQQRVVTNELFRRNATIP
jgi:hypothetical protein